MNELQQAFCDGASMAYRDVAKKMEKMIESSPPEIKDIMQCFLPLAEATRNKAVEVYKEVERFAGARL